MSRVKIDDLVGEEILEKEIVSENGAVLIPAGTRMKPVYIEKLSELGVKNVIIRDEKVSYDYRKSEIKDECRNKVKELIQRHFYSEKTSISKLEDYSLEIMGKILEKQDVIIYIDKLYHINEDIYIHSINVCMYSILVGIKMKLKKEQIVNIALGAILHDIGYILVDSKIKSNKNYMDDKSIQKEIKKHVIYGYSEVQNEKWLSEESKNIILHHHEREDGTGYPFKKKGKYISLGSKIVAVCDDFDNNINGNSKGEKKIYAVIEQIILESGKKYNKEVVKAFKDIISAYPNGTLVIDNYGDISVVVAQNVNFPTRPVLKVLKNKNNTNERDGDIKDLARELTVFIEDTLE